MVPHVSMVNIRVPRASSIVLAKWVRMRGAWEYALASAAGLSRCWISLIRFVKSARSRMA